MRKDDYIIVAILTALLIGWWTFGPKPAPRVAPEAPAVVEQSPAEPAVLAAAPADEPVVDTVPAVEEPVLELAPEQTLSLTNDVIALHVSSYGGAVVSAKLNNYPALNEEGSGPVELDFSAAPALLYDGLPPRFRAGSLEAAGSNLVYTAALGDGRQFKRTLYLSDDYLLTVDDSFINGSETPWVLPELRLPTGPMANPEGTSAMRGVTTLGVDSFSPVEGVSHWGKKFRKLRPESQAFTSDSEMVPPAPVNWVAAKNKFFVQVLTPEEGAGAFDFSVRREGEGKKKMAAEVSAALQFGDELVDVGSTVSRSARVYIGPKEFSVLKMQGMDQVEVMEFKSTGFWKFMNPIMYPLKKALLWGLVHLHMVFRNYGIAIMLLTVVIRMLFWPLTHKGTESMKRMQALQPQIKAIREKHKDNPQLMQQETMLFYKENKVNPMGGCLPMFIQIPVFIALFTVLRSSIELRFSKFLWISDLSEPENLFAGAVPFIGSLNILPILMAATMMWQQRLTPAAGDPQQQKMMAIMMPIMMLFFFYNMPSGLVLYWTTSQVIMIAQLMIKKKKAA